MKKLLTTASLFVAITVAIVSFTAPAVFGQEKKTAKVDPSPAGPIAASQADGWRTIQFETTQVTAPDVAVTPDGEWLIFTMLGKLFRLPVKGGEAEQLTFGPYYDNDPAISPDGKLVAFQSDRDSSEGNIFVLTLATKEIRQITRESWADRPAWSPDGQSLVYLRLDRKTWNLRQGYIPAPSIVVRVNLTGSGPETLSAEASMRTVFFLLDGRIGWTVFERNSASPLKFKTRIEIRDHEGRVSTMRTQDGTAHQVVVSPKGDGLYIRSESEAVSEVNFVPISEGVPRPIIPVSGESSGFAVSLNNASMFFGNRGHLWKVALPGGRSEAIPFRAKVTLAIRQSTAPPKWTPFEPGTSSPLRTIGQPELSPDGSRLVFQALGDLWEQPIKGGQTRQLVEGEGTESDPAFSPDGRQIAFVGRARGKRVIQILEFQSGKTRTVAPTECGYEQLIWSLQGGLIAATACDHDIVAIDPVALTARVLAKASDWEPYPQVSADGKTLYFQAEFPESKPALYQLRLEPDAKPEPLAPAIRDGLKMKTNGQWMARPIPNGNGIHLSPVGSNNGTQANGRALTEADGHEFSFTPDGSALLYVAGNKLWRHPLKDGAPQEIPIRLEPRVATPPPVLVERVRMLDFAAGGFGAETSLLIENGRIRRVGSAKGRQLPSGTVTVDAGGRFAIPGLFDMHGHQGGCGGAVNVSYGVTSVRNMGNRLEQQNAHADRSDFTGDAIPRCFYAGRILEGPQGRNEDWYFVHPNSEEDARMYVRRWKAEGAQFIKLYNFVPWPQQRAAADEARRLGLPVAAHGLTVEQVVKGVTLGYAGLTHWTGSLYDDAFQMFAASGTSWEPTLGVAGGLAASFRNDPERFRQVWWSNQQIGDNVLRGRWAEQLRTVRLAYGRGITLLPGTDNTATEGLALQWELEFYAEAGIPPLDILRFATKEAAKTVGAQDHLGTLEAGKLADLILLDANPLEDIKNTQKIWRVFKGGWMFDPKVLRPSAN